VLPLMPEMPPRTEMGVWARETGGLRQRYRIRR